MTRWPVTRVSHTNMPERLLFAHLFRGNPLAGTEPEEAFSLLNWGNQAQRSFEIDAPEPLIMLGMAKVVMLANKHVQFRRGEAFLTVGHQSNQLYIIPRIKNAPQARVPPFSRFTAKRIGEVIQTDYHSTKGREHREHHYFHKHEAPYPILWINEASHIAYIRAAIHNGRPSYAVGKAGIVG